MLETDPTTKYHSTSETFDRYGNSITWSEIGRLGIAAMPAALDGT